MRAALVIAAYGSLAGCAAASAAGGGDDWPEAAPAEHCDVLTADAALQARRVEAPDGATGCLSPGRYDGPVLVSRGIKLVGPRAARVVSNGVGTTVRLEGERSAVIGLTVDGSGGRYDTSDAAILMRGDHLRVERVRVVNAIFGILVERSRHAEVIANDVRGIGGGALGLRGDAIRLWETQESRLAGNRVRDGRDVVVWYSSDNVITDNLVEASRYGTHFMYSHRNRVEGNRYLGNVVGAFVMYSRDIVFSRNVIAGCLGAAGIGIGLKESGNIDVQDNLLVRNTAGIYLETSPLQQTDHNRWIRNQFRLSSTAVIFHSSPHGNTFEDNDLVDNSASVVVEGGGDARGVTWNRNHYDDYAGFDLDDDGIGDVPYELRSLSADLESRYPNLAFFRGTPALQLVELAGRALPLLTPTTILVDAAPRVHAMEQTHAH